MNEKSFMVTEGDRSGTDIPTRREKSIARVQACRARLDALTPERVAEIGDAAAIDELREVVEGLTLAWLNWPVPR